MSLVMPSKIRFSNSDSVAVRASMQSLRASMSLQVTGYAEKIKLYLTANKCRFLICKASA